MTIRDVCEIALYFVLALGAIRIVCFLAAKVARSIDEDL